MVKSELQTGIVLANSPIECMHMHKIMVLTKQIRKIHSVQKWNNMRIAIAIVAGKGTGC